jgi:aminoglycoside 6'-N-acetyltransferase
LHHVDDFLALAVEHNGELVGDVGMQLRSVSAAARCLEVSWMIHPDHQGKGFAYEATRAVLEFMIANVGALLIVAVVHPSNAASVALAHKLNLHPLPGAVDQTIFVGTDASVNVRQ